MERLGAERLRGMRRLTHLWAIQADALAQEERDADAGFAGVGHPGP